MKLSQTRCAIPTTNATAFMKTKNSVIQFVVVLFLLLGQSLLAAPVNDNFADATIISSAQLANPITGSNIDATKESGEPVDVAWPPNPRSPLGGKSVWWKLTPTEASEVTISTAGSSFDTQLGVYTGSVVSNLTEVASNEDAAGVTNGSSQVTFTTTAGTTYHILVDGYGAAQGSVVLNISGVSGTGTNGRPTVTITSPRPDARVLSADIVLKGKAHSQRTNDAIAEVLVQLNSGAFIIADGTTTWQANLTLVPGDNIVRVRSVTESGRESTTATRKIHFALITPLTIQIIGSGKVEPNLNGKNIEAGTKRHLVAIPAKDFLFVGWSGATNATNRTINFVMQPNAVLVATFVPDPLARVRGTFNGLIQNSNNVLHASSGFFSLTISRRTAFSAHFIIGGKRFADTGRVDENGHADLAFGSGENATTGSLQLDLNNGTDQVTGTISRDGVFTSTLLGDRAIFNSRTNPAPFAGKHNLNFLANETVHGNGWAMARVDGAGNLHVVGRLADGRTISQSVPVSKNGVWPFYNSLYGGNGSAFSWMTFANLPASSVSGLVTWFRPALTGALFPDGFATRVAAIGSLFITPPRNVPMLNWTSGIAVLGGNDLSDNITNLVTFNSNNTITLNFQLVGLKLKINSQGKLAGSFVDPTTQKTKPLEGVVLPKTNWAGGFFLGTNQSGFIFLGEDLSAGTNALISPPSFLNGLTLTIAATKKTGTFNSFNGTGFTFTDTNFTTDDPDFGTGTYNFSSAGSTAANVAELNLLGGTIHGHKVVVRVLLNFTSGTAGNFLAEITAGGSGIASGSFTLSGP